jgi:hypothetical protein
MQLILTASVVLALVVLGAAAVSANQRRREEPFIARKSTLYDAGITLDGPHVRALNTGGR